MCNSTDSELSSDSKFSITSEISFSGARSLPVFSVLRLLETSMPISPISLSESLKSLYSFIPCFTLRVKTFFFVAIKWHYITSFVPLCAVPADVGSRSNDN
eukprot:NODE_597_length_6263_cov_0.206035.p5 type:complete len:101 gc:universal NODE_597_length_6263_cov_0.206035:3709-3407(-)